MQKKILIILGHSDEQGLCGKIYKNYLAGAKEFGHEIKVIKLGELNFDPILHKGYREIQELEPDLKKAQEAILWAEHLVFIFPTWWSSFPAILKGFIDRIFLPGFGYHFEKGSFIQKKLLQKKTARLIITMDSPTFIYRWYFGAPGLKIMKKGVLNFCGINPVKTTLIGRVRFLEENQKESILQKINFLGKQGS
jgi:putative NADPH-quinone reductase